HLFTAGDDRSTARQALRRQHVTPFPVSVTDERNTRRTIGIVFERFNSCRHIMLIALKIDQAIQSVVTAAAMVRCNATGIVAPAAMVEPPAQAFFRPRLGDFVERQPGAKAYSCGGGLVSFNSH